ncbi:MAG: hypothetical protein FWE83_08490 [Oscillospiraceae bacterium]|nr:hypothetical protein [Oscillospiraceae bacterium]
MFVTGIAVDFGSWLFAVIEVDSIYEGVNKCCSKGDIICIAGFEPFKEEQDFILCENRSAHFLFRKLYFKF